MADVNSNFAFGRLGRRRRDGARHRAIMLVLWAGCVAAHLSAPARADDYFNNVFQNWNRVETSRQLIDELKIGSGEAVRLHHECVLNGEQQACDQLITRRHERGFATDYAIASAHYKRGNLKLLQNELAAALRDYEAAQNLADFPQIDREINQLRESLKRIAETSAIKPVSNANGVGSQSENSDRARQASMGQNRVADRPRATADQQVPDVTAPLRGSCGVDDQTSPGCVAVRDADDRRSKTRVAEAEVSPVTKKLGGRLPGRNLPLTTGATGSATSDSRRDGDHDTRDRAGAVASELYDARREIALARYQPKHTLSAPGLERGAEPSSSVIWLVITTMLCSGLTAMYLLHRRSATAASRSSDTYFPPTTDDHASGADGNAAALEDDWFASQPVEPALTWPDDLADHDVEPDFETTDEFAPQDVAVTPQDADAVPYDAPEPTFGNPVTLGATDAALRRNFPQIPAGHCYVVSQSADVRMHMLLEIIETRLQRPFEDHDQLIVLDTHGQLSDAIANRFNRSSGHGLHNNPIVIDPHAPTTPGMLNPFEIGDLGTDSFKRDQILNRAFEAQSYICEAFLGSAFVQENQSSLRHLIKLLTLIPGADFRTFLALLDPDNISEYEESIAQLDTPSSREFFTHSIFTREFARRTGHLRDKLSQFSDLSGFQHATGCGNSDPRLAAHIWAENIIAVRLAPDADGEVVTTTLRRIALAKAVALAPKRDARVGAERRRMVIVDDFFECFGADFVEFSRLMRELKEKTCELVLAHATADGVTGDILDQIASRFHSKLIATSDPLTRDMLGRAMNADDAMLQNVSANASQREFLFAGQDGQWRNFWLPTEPGEPSV